MSKPSMIKILLEETATQKLLYQIPPTFSKLQEEIAKELNFMNQRFQIFYNKEIHESKDRICILSDQQYQDAIQFCNQKIIDTLNLLVNKISEQEFQNLQAKQQMPFQQQQGMPKGQFQQPVPQQQNQNFQNSNFPQQQFGPGQQVQPGNLIPNQSQSIQGLNQFQQSQRFQADKVQNQNLQGLGQIQNLPGNMMQYQNTQQIQNQANMGQGYQAQLQMNNSRQINQQNPTGFIQNQQSPQFPINPAQTPQNLYNQNIQNVQPNNLGQLYQAQGQLIQKKSLEQQFQQDMNQQNVNLYQNLGLNNPIAQQKKPIPQEEIKEIIKEINLYMKLQNQDILNLAQNPGNNPQDIQVAKQLMYSLIEQKIKKIESTQEFLKIVKRQQKMATNEAQAQFQQNSAQPQITQNILGELKTITPKISIEKGNDFPISLQVFILAKQKILEIFNEAKIKFQLSANKSRALKFH